MPTVVIADDSPTLRRIVGTVLGRAGYTVVMAEDGVQAVQAVFQHQPDAVILDVQMPRVSGYVAARLIKDDWQTADIPVLLLTSLDAASDRYWGRHVGADAFITKDFEAPDLIDTLLELRTAADDKRGGRARLTPDPLELSDDAVFGRVCDLLDRKLFEAQVAADMTAIAADVHGFEETVAAVLGVIGAIVDYDLAALLMLDDRSTYLTVARETSHRQYAELFAAVADAASQVTGEHVEVHDLQPRLADPDHLLGADDEGDMATFLSMPLRARGRVVGVLALSSAVKSAFGEASLSTLRLVEQPAAVVIDNARLSGISSG
ncbi:MAG TPA: response regulator [Actinomycetes bacterium]|nr:response regulator [Actinomycetes bacterium]